MENALKALLIAAAVLIAILLITFGIRLFSNNSGVQEQASSLGKSISDAIGSTSIGVIAKTELTEEEAEESGWIWSGNSLTGYYGTEKVLYIPSKVGDKSIASMNNFNTNNDKTTKIVFPNTIKTIPGYKLNGFKNLQEVDLANFTSIVSYTFGGCNNLKTVDIPPTVTEITAYGLACSGINNIIIPKNVTKVGMGIFGWCTNGPIKIRCEAESKPTGWSDKWMDYAPEGTTVEWGYKGK